jgi:hypothetical protein
MKTTPTHSLPVIKNGYFDERKNESDFGSAIEILGVDWIANRRQRQLRAATGPQVQTLLASCSQVRSNPYKTLEREYGRKQSQFRR